MRIEWKVAEHSPRDAPSFLKRHRPLIYGVAIAVLVAVIGFGGLAVIQITKLGSATELTTSASEERTLDLLGQRSATGG